MDLLFTYIKAIQAEPFCHINRLACTQFDERQIREQQQQQRE